jgi:hypothetical protein
MGAVPIDTDLTPADVDVTEGVSAVKSTLESVFNFREMAMADVKGKDVTLIDTNLYSGSSDLFRTTMGGYYEVLTDPETLEQKSIFTVMSPIDPNPRENLKFPIASIISLTEPDISTTILEDVEDRATGYKADTLVPHRNFVCAVDGDTNHITNDKHWKILWTGGEINDVEVPAAYAAGSYDDHSIHAIHPYSAMEIREYSSLANLSETDFINESLNAVEISYDYNSYLPLFQAKAREDFSELRLPNINLMKSAVYKSNRYAEELMGTAVVTMEDVLAGDADITDLVTSINDVLADKKTEVGRFSHNPQLLNFLSIDGATENNVLDTRVGAENPATYMDSLFEKDEYNQYAEMKRYLDSTYVLYNLSASTIEYCEQRFKNIIYNRAASQDLMGDVWQSSSAMPYGIKISFPPSDGFSLRNAIEEENFDSRFMLMLKESFLEQTSEKVPINTQQYVRNMVSITGSENETPKERTTIDGAEYRSIDYFDLILHSYENIICEYDDFTIIESLEETPAQILAAYDKKGIYRYINGISTAKLLTETLTEVGDGTSAGNFFYMKDIDGLMNLQLESQEIWNPTVINASTRTPSTRIHETLAYRVEKFGATPTEEGYASALLQNFWIFNAADLKNQTGVEFDPLTGNMISTPRRGIDIVDTQVKYEKDYTYNIYAYKLVHGIKYRFSNLQLSRIIGDIKDMDSTTFEYVDDATFSAIDLWCIEYYDPETEQAVDDMLVTSAYNPFSVDPMSMSEYTSREDWGEWVNNAISQLASPAQRIAASRVSSLEAITADDSSTRYSTAKPYFANFLVTVEPSLRIVECPIFSKKLKIQDNPPNTINVEPTYALDNSNTIAFTINYETFNRPLYSDIVTSDDEIKKRDYLHANDLLEKTILEKESVSLQNRIQIFRLNKKPKQLKDFENNLISEETLNIIELSERAAYKDTIYFDTIKSNHKYYYLFRASNELDMPGMPTSIVEAELVNDGGYKYALFNTLDQSDLIEDEFDRTTKQLKKVFEIKPAVSQIILNVDNADFNGTAHSQMSNVAVGETESSIFDKTFKIRLTSKKTGKKIDLNITYKKNNDVLATD